MNDIRITTTDGYIVDSGTHCFTVDGTECIVIDDFINRDRSVKYLVALFYEGTAMDVRCYGGSHTEIECPFEIEGNETIVNAVFKNCLTLKKTEEYKNYKKKFDDLVCAFVDTKKQLKLATDELEKTNQSLFNKRLELDKMSMANGVISEQISTREKHRYELETKIGILEAHFDGLSVYDKNNELVRLINRDKKLCLLEKAGVDNWEFYDEALKEFD